MKNFIYEFRIKRIRRSTAAERFSVYSPLTDPNEVAGAARHLLQHEPRECFLVFSLDVSNKIIGYELVAIGTLTHVDVHPREIFRSAIMAGAAALVLIHNHPSGDPTLSAEDIALSERMEAVGSLVGIPVLDHIVVAESGHISYYEQTRGDPTIHVQDKDQAQGNTEGDSD